MTLIDLLLNALVDIFWHDKQLHYVCIYTIVWLVDLDLCYFEVI